LLVETRTRMATGTAWAGAFGFMTSLCHSVFI